MAALPATCADLTRPISVGLKRNEMKPSRSSPVLEDVGSVVGCCRIYEELNLSRTYDSAKAVEMRYLLCMLRF